MVACGNYINVYDDTKDVFVILNEPNDPPTPDEVGAIEKIVEDNMRDLANTDLNCLRYGFQVINKPAIPHTSVEALPSEQPERKKGGVDKRRRAL